MRKVITYGTFDLFHKGHYNIIKRAKALGDYLIVGVTSESYDIERGKLNVRDSLIKRIENVRRTGLADEIIVEEYQGQKINDIIKYNIDVLVVGSDWRGKFDYLRNYCEVIYLERTKNISSTKLRSQGIIFNVGIVTDDIQDNELVQESKYVSGIHVERVFSRNQETAREFCDKYELDSWWTDYDQFLSDVDIVYIKCQPALRAEYAEQAIRQGKYVISDAPVTLSSGKLRELFELAKENKVVLIERFTLVYLRAFNQLVWLVHSNLIGKLVSVKCAISQDYFEGGKSFNETICNAICAVIKLLGRDCIRVNTNAVKDGQGRFVYDMITLNYENALASIEIGTTVDVENELVIIGSDGRVTVPNDWWNTGYFEANIKGRDFPKRYSFNFEGNGFRYLLQELLIMIRDQRTECTRLFYDESVKILEILEKINQKD
ncbi:MAG: adenylyltransferase/cytidyltransferase family protein [Blautia sp.]|nr:adenylyltransferase/cytidyltransferase family protein [Blautia sp.]